jgi:hypothetical protein
LLAKAPKKKLSHPSVNKSAYELKEFKWKRKLFYKVRLPLLTNNINIIYARIERALELLKSKGYLHDHKKHMMLHEENKWWRKGNILIEIDKGNPKDWHVKVFDNKHIFSKNHVGHIKNLHESLKELGIHIDKKKKRVKDIYYWYIDAPRDKKKLNKFHTVVFVEVQNKE